MATSNGIGTSAAKLTIEASRAALDLVFREAALVLVDAGKLLGSPIDVPVPLIGFTYEVPSSYTLLRYEYSEFPYLNRSAIISGYVKNNTELTIISRRAITKVNNLITSIAINKAFLTVIEKYCDYGGRFALINTYDALASNLVLQELRIVPPENQKIGDISLEWSFKKLLFADSNVESSLSDSISNKQNGVAPNT